ncbi:MAG: class I SAM-dependent methyltransferase [Theionarchaea archaeon]|nr:class I SAM-dependent methyltransferase [Theionarchaea archaeon]
MAEVSQRPWEAAYSKGVGIVERPAFLTYLAAEMMKRETLKSVLDIGCAAGRNSVFLAREGFDVVGIEPQSTILEVARSKVSDEGAKPRLLLGDLVDLPFKESSFDAVLCLYVLMFLPVVKLATCVRNIFQVLRDSGMAFFAFYSPEDASFEMGECLHENTIRWDRRMGPWAGIEAHYFTHEEILHLFNAVEILSLHPVTQRETHDGVPHVHRFWQVICRKDSTTCTPVKERTG